MSDDNCTYTMIKNATDSCSFATESCSYVSAHLYYCEFNQNIIATIVFLAFGLTISFAFLQTTADNYMSVSMEHICKKFKLSQAFAGVTLLALANGAPDVMVSFAAGAIDSDGISLSLGALFGAGLFTCTYILGYCIHICDGKIQLDRRESAKDIIFYIIANTLIIIFAMIGYINRIMAFCYISIYLIFIFYVLWIEKTREKEELQGKKKEENQEVGSIQGRKRGETKQLNDMDYLMNPVDSQGLSKLTFSNGEFNNKDFLINQADQKMSQIMKKSYIKFIKGKENSLLEDQKSTMMDSILQEEGIPNDQLQRQIKNFPLLNYIKSDKLVVHSQQNSQCKIPIQQRLKIRQENLL